MIHYAIYDCPERQDPDSGTRDRNEVDCPACLRTLETAEGILERFWERFRGEG